MRWLPMAIIVLALGWSAPVRAQHATAEKATGGHSAHVGEDVSEHVLDPSDWRADLAVFTLIVFAILMIGLSKSAWPKISKALEDRETGIRSAISEAHQARLDAAEMIRKHQAQLDAAHLDVKAILDEARRDAERTKNDIVAAANSEATATKDRAIAEIERAKGQALNEIFDRLAAQVASATEHVVGRAITPEDQNRLIREALAEVSPN